MENIENILSGTEALIYRLRSIYGKFGYSSYKMSKFEEYDLYARNKDFLISDSIITFTDTNGRLMALKPDVTLSIIKNIEDLPDSIQKYCYNENVYRVSKSTDSFREIMQTGLECIGNLDSCRIGEVLYLAAESLKACSDSFVLDVSDLDILSALIDMITDSKHIRKEIIKCIGEKNTHGIYDICSRNGIDKECAEPLTALMSLYGKPADVFGKLLPIAEKANAGDRVEKLRECLSVFDGTGFENSINIDFSVVDDFRYYNGIVFKGFVEGIPESVLSGGQYDSLMKEMKRKSKAAGFAVYVDKLDRLINAPGSYEADYVLTYGSGDSPASVIKAIRKLSADGEKVIAVKDGEHKVNGKKSAVIENGEVKIIE